MDDPRHWGASGWHIDGRHYGNSNSHWPSEVVRGRSGYVPFQSVFDTSGRYAYQPGGQQYPHYMPVMQQDLSGRTSWASRRPPNAGMNQEYGFSMRDRLYYGQYQMGPWR